jgi:glycerate-2-kinase
MSDVINDRIDLIASGLTTCDPSTFLDALEVLNKYDLWDKAPQSVKEVISAGIKGDIPETLKDCKLAEGKIENTIILKNADFLAHLEDYLKSLGFAVFNLGSDFHLNIENMVQILVKKAQELTSQSPHKPIAIVAGGEASLKVIGKGKGGRNQELVLRIAVEMSKFNKTFVFTSLGTDGIDGITDAAGAICDSETMKRAKILNLDPEKYLKRNDSYNFFKKIEDLIFTGHTGINVKDVYCLLLLSQQNPITTL